MAAGAADESARQLREKKRVLAALVVHDLRSPLSAIQGCLEGQPTGPILPD